MFPFLLQNHYLHQLVGTKVLEKIAVNKEEEEEDDLSDSTNPRKGEKTKQLGVGTKDNENKLKGGKHEEEKKQKRPKIKMVSLQQENVRSMANKQNMWESISFSRRIYPLGFLLCH